MLNPYDAQNPRVSWDASEPKRSSLLSEPGARRGSLKSNPAEPDLASRARRTSFTEAGTPDRAHRVPQAVRDLRLGAPGALGKN